MGFKEEVDALKRATEAARKLQERQDEVLRDALERTKTKTRIRKKSSPAPKPEDHNCEWKEKYDALRTEFTGLSNDYKRVEQEAANARVAASVTASANEALRAERDSACAAFSEALTQVAAIEAEAKKAMPGKIKIFKLANSALELAKYARALEGNESTPGSYILQVEELVKDMV